jgi:AcrR family transcriptional regulator
MSDALTPDRILDSAEQVLRRYGPGKATVVEVARALGMSHGSVYRHFPSKVALRDAVAERWLARVSTPLAAVAGGDGPPPARLRHWLVDLSDAKRRMAREDPELFQMFHSVATQARDVVTEHLRVLASQIAIIVSDGMAAGDFAPTDPAVAGWAVLHATARFHHPAHAAEWADPNIDVDLSSVVSLLLSGLRAGPAAGAAICPVVDAQATAPRRRSSSR